MLIPPKERVEINDFELIEVFRFKFNKRYIGKGQTFNI